MSSKGFEFLVPFEGASDISIYHPGSGQIDIYERHQTPRYEDDFYESLCCGVKRSQMMRNESFSFECVESFYNPDQHLRTFNATLKR